MEELGTPYDGLLYMSSKFDVPQISVIRLFYSDGMQHTENHAATHTVSAAIWRG